MSRFTRLRMHLYGKCTVGTKAGVGDVHIHSLRKRVKECVYVVDASSSAAGSAYLLHDEATVRKVLACKDWMSAVAVVRQAA